MALTNKLITFNKLTSFETQLAQGNILETSIVFIKDAKKIWTKGTYFDCSGGGSNIPIIELPTGLSGTLDESQLTVLNNEPNMFIALLMVSHNSLAYVLFTRDIIPGLDDVFSYSANNNSYTYTFTKSGENYSVTQTELALKSDIPNTDDFATQANLTSAVTQLTTNLAKKQDKLVSGTSIKTINSTSLLGSGNIAIKDTKNLTYILNNSTSGTVTLQPNACIYMPNPLTGKLAINACSTISSNNADLIESRICFRMPNNAIMPVIQFNGVAIRWAGGNAPTFEADFTYEVSLFYPSNANNVGPMGVCVGFK